MEVDQPIRILLVEDVPPDAELAERELRKEGIPFVSLRVETRQAFLAALKEFGPDLVISDYALPEFNGMQALELTLERGPALPFILLTGSMNEETAVACMKAGATDYVLKERIARLPFAVRDALAQKKNRLAKEEAERALRESEARFSTVFRASPISIGITRLADGHFIDVNAAFLSMFGYTREEVIGRTALELKMWGYPEEQDRLVKIVREQGRLRDAETKFRKKSGEIGDALASAELIELAGEHFMLSLLHDITERKRAEERLRLSDEILSRVNALILVANTEGSLVYASPSFKTVLGYAPDDLLGDGWWNLSRVDPHEREREKARVARAARSGVPITETLYERPVWNREGEARWILWHDAKGPGDLVIGVGHDITERRQRERELEAIAAIATALRAAPTRAAMLPVIVHQAFNALTADGAALAIPEPTTGGTVIAFAHGAWADWPGAHLPPGAGVSGHVLTTGRSYLSDNAANDPRIVPPDLIDDLRAIACVPLIAQDQTIGALWVGRKTAITLDELRLLVAISDIAANALQRAEIVETLEQRVAERTRELAQANARLEELDRLKSKFVSDVSHELRTPVTILKLHADLLKHGKPEKREYYMTVIYEQAERQAQLVEDILNLSRLELGADRVKFALVALNLLVSQIVAAHQLAAEAAGLALTFTPAPDLPSVPGEYNQLAQVITNLVANAINYTPAGQVQVSTGLNERHVFIEVRDTGMGIEPEDLPHVFERFYRGRHSRQIRGTGLGLAIIKEIVDLHDGKVEVDSEVGAGSAFRVYLPTAGQGE